MHLRCQHLVGFGLLLLALFRLPFARAEDGAAKVTEAVEKLERQLDCLEMIRPNVERPDLGRLVILRNVSRDLLATIREKGPFHIATLQGAQNLIVTYRYSKFYFQSISTASTAPAIQEAQDIVEYFAKEYGFDETINTKVTCSVFTQLHKLALQLLGLGLTDGLRAALESEKPLLGEMIAYGEQGDTLATLTEARPRCRKLRELYPLFYQVASSDAAFELTLEIQGLLEWYIERFQIGGGPSGNASRPRERLSPGARWLPDETYPPAQLAVGYNIACLLRQGLWTEGESLLKCWGLGVYGTVEGQPLAIPPLPHIQQVAASRSSVCALSEARVICWGYGDDDGGPKGFATKTQQELGALTYVTSIAGGPHSFCAVDRQEGIKCYHGEYSLKESEPYALARKMAVGGVSSCVIGGDGSVHCWEYLSGRCTYSMSVDHGVQHAQEISVSADDYSTRCRTCVIEDGDVKCWGNVDDEYGKYPGPTGLHHPSDLVQLDITLREQDTTPCVLEDGVVLCRQLPGKFVPYDGFSDLPKITALGGFVTTHCAANDQYLKCRFGNHFQKNTLTIPHGIWFVPFNLFEVDTVLDKLAEDAYAAKADIYRAGAQALRDLADREKLAGDVLESFRLFFLNALRPLVEMTDTEFFSRFLRPNWEAVLAEYNPKHGVHSLKDFAPSSATRLASLSLLRAAMPVLRGALTAPDQQSRVDDLNAALGVAIATKGAPSSLADLAYRFDLLHSEMDALAAAGREGSAVALMRGLVAYLR